MTVTLEGITPQDADLLFQHIQDTVRGTLAYYGSYTVGLRHAQGATVSVMYRTKAQTFAITSFHVADVLSLVHPLYRG